MRNPNQAMNNDPLSDLPDEDPGHHEHVTRAEEAISRMSRAERQKRLQRARKHLFRTESEEARSSIVRMSPEEQDALYARAQKSIEEGP